MAHNSKIEWTDHTANLWWGCTKVHEGCDNCYAEALDNRYNHDKPHWGNEVPRKYVKSIWGNLKAFQIEAAKVEEPAKTKFNPHMRSVFVGSMMDIFEKDMPLEQPAYYGAARMDTTDALRKFLFEVMIPECPNLLFLLLTKRPSNINKYIPESWKETPPANVMFGTSVVNHATAVRLLPQLLAVNGKKFLSIEPQLDEIDFYKVSDSWESETNPWRNAPILTGIDWVICGGESGAGRRPFNLAWARILRDQCKDGNVPFFFKQIDKVRDKAEGIPADLQVREFPVIDFKP